MFVLDFKGFSTTERKRKKKKNGTLIQPLNTAPWLRLTLLHSFFFYNKKFSNLCIPSIRTSYAPGAYLTALDPRFWEFVSTLKALLYDL